MDFVPPCEMCLNCYATEVSMDEIRSDKFQDLLEQMIAFAKGEQGDLTRTVMVGLAAPQVGISKRIILVDVQADGKGQTNELRVYVNPHVVWASTEMEVWYEGCYSTGNIAGIVSRPKEVLIRALDRHGSAVQEKHIGYVARIFQHEIDHLNGIRFPMRIRNPNDLHLVEIREFPLYRNQEMWREWHKKCSWSHWLEVINTDK